MGLLRPRRVGIVGMAARTAVVAGTATAVSGRVAHRQQEKYEQKYQADQYEALQQQAAAAPVEPAAAPAAPDTAAGGGDVVGQLEQLSQLHNSGVLNDEQFEAAKAKLLS
jgi:Short C-terminal domain